MFYYFFKAVGWLFWKFPAGLVKRVYMLVKVVALRGWYATTAALAVVLIFGSLTAFADLSTFGQVNSIAKTGDFQAYTMKGMEDKVQVTTDSFGYKYAKNLSGILRIPVFTPQFASPTMGRIAGAYYYTLRYGMNTGFALFVLIITVFLFVVLYFLAYDLVFGFAVIGIGLAIDGLLHLLKIEGGI